jgi:hypothetical protein
MKVPGVYREKEVIWYSQVEDEVGAINCGDLKYLRRGVDFIFKVTGSHGRFSVREGPESPHSHVALISANTEG